MRKTGAALAATMVLGLLGPVGLAGPVQAEVGMATDEAGDVGQRLLDVTRVAVDNGDDRVVVRVRLVRTVPGDVIVSLDRRQGRGVRLLATKDADGRTTGRVVAGAFTDRAAGDRGPSCRGFRVRWSSDVVRMTMPSSCLNAGSYGALRFAVLTERGGSGSDADWAPDTTDRESGHSAWIARG